MSQIYFLCPADDISRGDFENIAARITPHLDRAGVCFSVTDIPPQIGCTVFLRDNQDPQTIARRIIEDDGKEFVPVTPGEYVDESIRLGFFPADTDWEAPLTKKEAAILAVRLLHLLRP